MGLNIKNPQVEALAEEVARLAGESKTEAIRKALLERRERLKYRRVETDDHGRVMEFLRREVWPRVPRGQRGQRPSADEEAAILGYDIDA
ncbi:MAG TPA: type II toxin-antitoxin system VapB family antitoxin [Gemmatimonadaceae bacterium]|jgi:antitoxin VapB|nr:type II toxin-antitoxin system VapB family antitoxin [Gemmatimonadaceae bacterium]